jgi:hypothetical protein
MSILRSAGARAEGRALVPHGEGSLSNTAVEDAGLIADALVVPRGGDTCSGSPTETLRLANRSPFGLTFADNEGALWLTLRPNGLTIIDKGSQTDGLAHDH